MRAYGRCRTFLNRMPERMTSWSGSYCRRNDRYRAIESATLGSIRTHIHVSRLGTPSYRHIGPLPRLLVTNASSAGPAKSRA